MEGIVTKIKQQTPEESMDVIKEETIEITSTPSIMESLERAEQPLLSQSERNLRQMIEDENLIFSVQKFPIIYDRTNPNYQNKEQVRYVWSLIAENASRSQFFVPLVVFFEDKFMKGPLLPTSRSLFYQDHLEADYCHKRWRYLRDYFVRQLRYHRSTTDPSKLKRPWVLFNKLTFLIPFVAHVVEKSNVESYNDTTVDNQATSLNDYLFKFQNENYFECEGAEINDLKMDLNAESAGEADDVIQENQIQQQEHGIPNSSKKRRANSNIELDSGAKPFQTVKRTDYSLDEHDHFLYSIAPEIRKIETKFTLHFRNEVHNLIMKYQSMSSNGE